MKLVRQYEAALNCDKRDPGFEHILLGKDMPQTKEGLEALRQQSPNYSAHQAFVAANEDLAAEFHMAGYTEDQWNELVDESGAHEAFIQAAMRHEQSYIEKFVPDLVLNI